MQIRTNIENLARYKKYLSFKNSLRMFLNNEGFLDLDLPVLTPYLIPEAYLEVFETEYFHFDKKEKLYLTPSPELFIKRLLVEGISDCFYLGKSFRNNEAPSSKHSPEFTMLEIYKTNANYMDMADTVLKLLRHLSNFFNKEDYIYYDNKKISFSSFEKITVAEAFSKFAQISQEVLFDKIKFLKIAKDKGYVTEGFTYEDLWSQIYTQEIEPFLGTNGFPTLIYDYPTVFAPLSKQKNKLVSERFEFYINGVELGNCYTELSDYKIQNERLIKEEQERKNSGKIVVRYDTGFINALKKGLPDCAGIAIGVERLGMIFCGITQIEDLKILDIC
jgi:elongation factor P--beta-lysine ligase